MNIENTHTVQKIVEMIVSRVLRLLNVEWWPEANPLVDADRLSLMTDHIHSIIRGVTHFCDRNDSILETETFRIIYSLENGPIGPQRLFMLRRHLVDAKIMIFSTGLDFGEKILFLITLVALLCNWCLQNGHESYITEASKMITIVLCTHFSGPIELTLLHLRNYAKEYVRRGRRL